MRSRQKCVATDTWRSLGCRTTPLEHWSRSKPTVEPRWANFIWSLHGMLGWKFVQIFWVTWPMSSRPIHGKTFKHPLFSEPSGRWPWKLVYSNGYSSTTKFGRTSGIPGAVYVLKKGALRAHDSARSALMDVRTTSRAKHTRHYIERHARACRSPEKANKTQK